MTETKAINFKPTEYGKFSGVNISDVNSLSFFWSWNGPPTITNINSLDVGKTVLLSKIVRNKLIGISRPDFFLILKDAGVEIADTETKIEGLDVITFFYIVENIEEYK